MITEAQGAKMIMDWTVTYGLGIVLSIFIAFAFWRILLFVLRENSKREERLANIIEKDLAGLSDKMDKTNGMLEEIVRRV